MTIDGTGSRSSPILIHDSEEEIVREISYNQFSRTLSSNDINLESHHQQTDPIPGMAAKRKFQEEPDEASLNGGSCLENRLTQPETKKARKRRRQTEREALERSKLQLQNHNNGRLDANPPSNPTPTGPRFPLPSRQPRPDTDREYSELLQEMLRLEEDATLVFYQYGPPTPPPPSSAFDSDWVSSMVKAGEFQHQKKIKPPVSQTLPSRLPPPSESLPARPPSLAPQILPPIHIHPNLHVAHNPPSQIPPEIPQGGKPQPSVPLTIGMKRDQDPDKRHGIFHITDSTRESTVGMRKRKHSYVPNPSRTLVMEQLPKTHRTIEFIDRWCRNACGVPAIQLFVDPPSAKALIEFASADLARNAWASPRLGQHLLGVPSQLLKGKPREDQIKVWWYRVADIVDAGGGEGVIEIEEGEIKERGGGGPLEHRKEKKTARLTKEREAKRVEGKKENQPQLQAESMSALAPGVLQPSTSFVPAVQSYPLLAQEMAGPPLNSMHPPSAPPAPKVPPSSEPIQALPSASSSPYTTKTAVGPSLAPGARGGHDDTASIASSVRRPSPDPQISKPPSKGVVVVATTVGQADDLADYSEVEMDVDDRASNVGEGKSVRPPPPPPKTLNKIDGSSSNRPSTRKPAKEKNLPSHNQSVASGRLREETRSKPVRHQPPHLSSRQHALPSRPSFQMNQSSSSLPSLSNLCLQTPMAFFSTLPEIPPHPTNSNPKALASLGRLNVSERTLSSSSSGQGKGKGKDGYDMGVEPDSVSASVSTPASLTVGQAMEDNLRQLVFASKRARASGIPIPPSSTLSTKPAAAEGGKSESGQAIEIVSPNPSLSSATPSTSASGRFSFEDLAVTFITQTIESVKANNQLQTSALVPPDLTAMAAPAPPITPSNATTAHTSTTMNLTKSELSAKQRRLEKHLEESKSLMERISKAKTKREKELLLKLMSEKMRLFEEESKANERKMRRRNTKQAGVLHFRLWPTVECSSILVLSDDEE